jgi:hypothetical protein
MSCELQNGNLKMIIHMLFFINQDQLLDPTTLFEAKNELLKGLNHNQNTMFL